MLGEIFVRFPEPDAFRKAILSLNGEFAFTVAEMIELGEAYFRRYPDTAFHRDRESVLIGYALVRVCVIERIIRGLTPAGREFYRAAFRHASSVGPGAEQFGTDVLAADLASVERELADVRATIEEIPKGPVKERFIGGISHLFNVLYLVRMNIKKADRGNPGLNRLEGEKQ